MATGKLKKLYEHPLFHGIKTVEEAQDICKAELEQFGKPGARPNHDGTQFEPRNTYIWFLMDNNGELSSVIYRYDIESEIPFERLIHAPCCFYHYRHFYEFLPTGGFGVDSL